LVTIRLKNKGVQILHHFLEVLWLEQQVYFRTKTQRKPLDYLLINQVLSKTYHHYLLILWLKAQLHLCLEQDLTHQVCLDPSQHYLEILLKLLKNNLKKRRDYLTTSQHKSL